MAVLKRLGGQASPPRPADGPATVVAPPPLPAGPPAHSIIGRDLVIAGSQLTIITRGVLQVDGVIQGELRGQQIIVGEHGRVTGTVAAEKIEVHGQVSGALRGLAVMLHPTARVEGDIHHRTLAIAEGAAFDGRVRRPTDPAELQPELELPGTPQAVAA
jgi:cytoskeletal protein CcmA (bactofilin family)